MMLRRVKGIDPVTRWVVNALGALAVIVAGAIAYNWNDNTPPSFIVAMWVIPDKLHAGETFTIREIYMRERLCARHIDHGFSQGPDGDGEFGSINEPTYGMHRISSPDDLLWPQVRGLLTTNFDAEVPVSLNPGKATYVMSLVWTCWWNPISYVAPYRRRLTYPVTILPEDEIQGLIIIPLHTVDAHY